MIELILLLCIYTIYEFYTGRLTIDNILSLLTICILKLYGKELYWFIDAFIKKYDIPNTISIHVRRTDHISLASKHNKYTSDIDFDNFIKK